MRNVKISKYLVIFTIGLFIGSGFMPSINCMNNNETSDEIDQQQQKYNASTALLGTMLFAQLFKPGLETLTRVELFMNKLGNLYGNSILSIRESLSGDDLTSVSKESIEINNDMEWIEFDFPDIQVTPGGTYYIVLKPDPDSDGGWGFNYISWAFGLEDPYPKGVPFWKHNGSWNEDIPGQSSADYAFITYGKNGNNEDNVEITISAGNFNKDIGFGVSIDVINYKKESVIINYSITRDRYFVKDFPETYENNFTAPPEEYWASLIGVGNEFIIYNLNISAWFGEHKINREGISIGELVILK